MRYRIHTCLSTKKLKLQLLLGLLILAIASLRVQASGTYPPVVPARPPQPGESSRVDARTYEAGKRIFTGRMPLMNYDPRRAARQSQLLVTWQTRIPAPENARVNLTRLTGRLSEYQLRALEYYLAIRYRIPTR